MVPLRVRCAALFAVFMLVFDTGAIAQPPGSNVHEVIVLLAAGPGSMAPEEVVDAINRGQPPPGLGEGNPRRAEVLASRRGLPAPIVQWMDAEPETDFAKMHRYILLEFPEQVNLEGVMQALSRSTKVQGVEPNLTLRLSAGVSVDSMSTPQSCAPGPNDNPTLDPGLDPDCPELFQWAVPVLRLKEAWTRQKGYATLGIADTGLQEDHEDLRAYIFAEDGVTAEAYVGGAYRRHLSFDVDNVDCVPDEMQDRVCNTGPINPTSAGHGTAVAGIAAGTHGNGLGTAGACPGCSLIMAQATTKTGFLNTINFFDVSEAFMKLIGTGTQVINLSAGASTMLAAPCVLSDTRAICTALNLARARNILTTASAGNDLAAVEFPAADPRVMAIGGIEESGEAWSHADETVGCPCTWPGINLNACNETALAECGSNFGPSLDLVLPARNITSTAYLNKDQNASLLCGDGVNFDSGEGFAGFGICTGTSTSSPEAASILALILSCNPLLTPEEVEDIVISTASHALNRNDFLGYGVPDAEASVRKAFGSVGGKELVNRLTPLFTLYNPDAMNHAHTVFPSTASSLVAKGYNTYEVLADPVPGYEEFPDVPCVISGCGTVSPAASFYVFTSDTPPDTGMPPLVPLYRLSYDPNRIHPDYCFDDTPSLVNRDFSYVTKKEDVIVWKRDAIDGNAIGYDLDGVEGYIFQRCIPDCKPEGTERIFRLYSSSRDDHVLVPEPDVPEMESRGYSKEDIVGYAPANVDSDRDHVIDFFERIIGTSQGIADSDCDGMTDGEEILAYDMSNPDPTRHSYGDPLTFPCGLFADGFESGTTSLWSSVETGS